MALGGYFELVSRFEPRPSGTSSAPFRKESWCGNLASHADRTFIERAEIYSRLICQFIDILTSGSRRATRTWGYGLSFSCTVPRPSCVTSGGEELNERGEVRFRSIASNILFTHKITACPPLPWVSRVPEPSLEPPLPERSVRLVSHHE